MQTQTEQTMQTHIRLQSGSTLFTIPGTLLFGEKKTQKKKQHLFTFEPPHDKTNKMTVHPAKTQISLGIRSVWSESSLCAQWVAKDPRFLHADSEDPDQTGRMPKLTLIRLGECPGWSESSLSAYAILLVLSWGGSFKNNYSMNLKCSNFYDFYDNSKFETI